MSNLRDKPDDILALLGDDSSSHHLGLVGAPERIPTPDYGTPPPSNISEELLILSDDELIPPLQLENNEHRGIDTIRPPPAKLPKLDSRNRGKPLDAVWKEFHLDNPQGNADKRSKEKPKCNYCNAAVSAKAERLKAHLSKCSKYKEPSVSRRKSEPDGLLSNEALKLASQTKQPKATSFVDTMTKTEQDEMNLEIGKYIFATNHPFSHVEHPAFSSLIRRFRPAYKLPHRRCIGDTILNKIYEKVVKERDQSVSGKYVTIMQDGWKTRTSEPVIAHSIVCENKSFFYNAIGTEENIKSSKYCASLLKETIAEIQAKGADVIAVVTDNCSSMEKMRKLINEDYTGIFTYGCHSHLLNLVGKKVTPEEIMEKVQLVHTYFRNHDAAWAALKKTKVARPTLPSQTRWNAWQDAFEYFLKNHAKMLQTSRNPDAKVENEEVLNVLKDHEFYNTVEETVKYMKPIQVALDQTQRENALLADGVHAWLKLRGSLVLRDVNLQSYFTKQFERALQPVGVAAYMLHPKYRGEGLEPALVQKGNEFLAPIHPTYVIMAAQLQRMNTTYFPKEYLQNNLIENCSPVNWWTSQVSLEKLSPHLINFASKLCQLPAGSAEIERHFSTLGNIISVRRSRLGMEKASKLCVIYKHYATCSEDDEDYLD